MCRASLRKGLRVIVVDDNRDSRELLIAVFEEYEVEIAAATCVSELFEIMQQMQPDFLISEMVLPGQDGYALIEQLKAFEAKYQMQIPAIALTVCAREEDRVAALAAGFCRYLTKPLDIDQLLETVAGLIKPVPEIA